MKSTSALTPFHRHRVVQARAHAADRAMAFERHQARLLRCGGEGLVELGIRERERHVHPRARVLRDRVLVERRAVDRRVQLLRLGAIALADAAQPALPLEPLEHEPRHVPREGRRRVEHRAVLRHGREIDERRRRRACATEQVFAHYDEREAGGTDVLLRARVDHAELRDVDWPRQDRRGHVRDQRHTADVRNEVVFHAADRLVRRVVQISRVGGALPARDGRDRHVGLARVRGDVDACVVLRFADRLLRPRARVHVIDDALGRRQIERNRRELRGGAALQEQHFVVLRHRQQLAQIRLGSLRRSRRTPCRDGSSPSRTCRCRASRAAPRGPVRELPAAEPPGRD